jgi:hypothetical protein
MIAFLAVVNESVLLEHANEVLVVERADGSHAIISGSV